MPTADNALITWYLEPNPNRPGPADWWLKDYGVSVWALVGYWLTVGRDADRVATSYAVPIEAVEAALAYYTQNREIIDARLAANAA
jgi:uncharacterized protein (DUF433 family)